MSFDQKKQLSLLSLEGTWYIHMTDFPMWLKGDKTNPTLNYSIKQKKGIQILEDRVIYQKNNKQKTILGFDTPLDHSSNRKFIWRGQGILSILKSHWEVLYISENENWAVIYFEKTLFTPKGYDVISRNKILDSATKKRISEILSAIDIKAKLTFVKQD